MSGNLDVHDLRPFIGSKDFDLSRDFYLALGWTQTYDSADLRLLELGGRSFYLQKYFKKAWCHNTMLHVSVIDVDAWYEKITTTFKEKNLHKIGRVSEGIENRDYGRTFFVWDPAGVLVHFTQFHD